MQTRERDPKNSLSTPHGVRHKAKDTMLGKKPRKWSANWAALPQLTFLLLKASGRSRLLITLLRLWRVKSHMCRYVNGHFGKLYFGGLFFFFFSKTVHAKWPYSFSVKVFFAKLQNSASLSGDSCRIKTVWLDSAWFIWCEHSIRIPTIESPSIDWSKEMDSLIFGSSGRWMWCSPSLHPPQGFCPPRPSHSLKGEGLSHPVSLLWPFHSSPPEYSGVGVGSQERDSTPLLLWRLAWRGWVGFSPAGTSQVPPPAQQERAGLWGSGSQNADRQHLKGRVYLTDRQITRFWDVADKFLPLHRRCCNGF